MYSRHLLRQPDHRTYRQTVALLRLVAIPTLPTAARTSTDGGTAATHRITLHELADAPTRERLC